YHRPLQRPDPLQSLTTLASTRSPSGASDERVGPSARALVRFLAVQARLDTAPRVEIDDSMPRVAMASVALAGVLLAGCATERIPLPAPFRPAPEAKITAPRLAEAVFENQPRRGQRIP